MSTALQVCAAAYREANLEQDLTSFAAQDFPFSLALQLMNKVIAKMNLKGKYWFRQTTTLLPFTAGTYQYNLTTLGIDPNSIIRMLSIQADGTTSEILPINYRDYARRYPFARLQLNRPSYYSVFNDTFSLNAIPDVDYGLTIYHLSIIPDIANDSDMMPCPEQYEQVFQDGVYAYLLKRLQYPEADSAPADWLNDVGQLLAKVKNNSGIANQLPAAF